MLQRVETKECEFRYFFTGSPYAEYAALILWCFLIVIANREIKIQTSIASKQGQIPVVVSALGEEPVFATPLF